MAIAASNMMCEKAFRKQIDEATAKLDAAAENLARKYIPAPVLACVKEYPDNFEKVTRVSITTLVEKNGYVTSDNYITGKLSFPIPNGSRNIVVERTEYEALRKLNEKVVSLVFKRSDFKSQVYDALIALGTEKKVQDELPEALNYLSFPETKKLPAPIFTGLREVIANIKDE